MQIIAHRGLQPSTKNFPTESSWEAFNWQLGRGFGLEFDFNLTQDNQVVVFHDVDLKRITDGVNLSKFADLTSREIENLRFWPDSKRFCWSDNRFCWLDELLTAIELNEAPMNALHLKGKFQTDVKYLDILLEHLFRHRSLLGRLLVIDVTVKTAEYLKSQLPELNLAPSVAHNYDIERYNQCVLGTLLSTEEVIANKHLFNWVWLDEWDLADKNGGQKKFYTAEVFKTFKDEGIKVALVTPELHGTSPGLLGGEAHPDADKNRLFGRIQEIIDLQPDALCTDYPEEVGKLIKQ